MRDVMADRIDLVCQGKRLAELGSSARGYCYIALVSANRTRLSVGGGVRGCFPAFGCERTEGRAWRRGLRNRSDALESVPTLNG